MSRTLTSGQWKGLHLFMVTVIVPPMLLFVWLNVRSQVLWVISYTPEGAQWLQVEQSSPQTIQKRIIRFHIAELATLGLGCTLLWNTLPSILKLAPFRGKGRGGRLKQRYIEKKPQMATSAGLALGFLCFIFSAHAAALLIWRDDTWQHVLEKTGKMTTWVIGTIMLLIMNRMEWRSRQNRQVE